jgi:hypothetical protein
LWIANVVQTEIAADGDIESMCCKGEKPGIAGVERNAGCRATGVGKGDQIGRGLDDDRFGEDTRATTNVEIAKMGA